MAETSRIFVLITMHSRDFGGVYTILYLVCPGASQEVYNLCNSCIA